MSGDRIFLALVAGQQDEQGRIISHLGMWPASKFPLAVQGLQACEGLDVSDSRGARIALGLPPRLVVTRGESEATGVAGVEQ